MAKRQALLALSIGLQLAISWVIGSGSAFAFASKPNSIERVWIKRSDKSLQCQPKGAQSLEDAAHDLGKAKIRVLESKKVSDGKMRIQMCGAPTGEENAFLIEKSDLELARTLGFQPVP